MKFYEPLPIVYMVFWPPYPWYIDSPTHGISTLLPMVHVYRPPYPWHIDPPTHGISTPLTMIYQPPTHGILTLLPMVYRPHNHGILTPYPWYIEPPTHGISTPPTHGISTPLPMVFWPPSIFWLEMRGVKIPWGFNLPYRGRSVFNKGVNIPWMKIDHGVNLQWGSKYHMTSGCTQLCW